MFAFDLVDEAWIPVLTVEGRAVVSLRESLINAHRYVGLALDSPIEAIAVFRQVLLPVYLDAVFREPGCPLPRDGTQWAHLWNHQDLDVTPPWAPAQVAASGHDGPIPSYLTRHRDQFGLFGDRPFAQVAGLRTGKDETKPVSLLIASAASGNNVPLFSARTEGDPPALSPAEAIRAVLATQCWDTAAIKSGAVDDPSVKGGKTTGNPTGPLGMIGVVWPVGRTLAETLLLHVPVSAGFDPTDRPQWQATGPADDPAHHATWRRRHARGLLDLLTWQARRIRLVPETGPNGATVVRRVVLTAGDRLERTPQADPHAAWRMSKQSKEQVPVRHTVGQAAWRGMLPLLATVEGSTHGLSTPVLRGIRQRQDEGRIAESYPLRVVTIGTQYGNQSAVVEDAIVDQLPLPVAALNNDRDVFRLLEDMVAQAEELRGAANRLGDDLRQAAGGEKLPWDRGQRVGDRMVHEFTPTVRRVLSGLQRDPGRVGEAELAWRAEARRVAWATADQVLSASPPVAFLGRAADARTIHRSSLAEVWFRTKVRKILGDPPPVTPSGGA